MSKSIDVKQNCSWATSKINNMCEYAMKTDNIEMLDDAHSIYEEFMEWIDSKHDSENTYVIYVTNKQC